MEIIKKPNFESVNYRLRPAKGVERKMLCDAFSRLSVLDDIKNYRYIGFGSTYFTDFILLHKTLGIRHLLSIEKEIDYEERIKFNLPFSCVDVVYGESHTELARLPWQKWKEKSIVWLDYTDRLTTSIIGDVSTVISNIKPGSIVLVSVNINEDQRDHKKHKVEPYKSLTNKELRMKLLEERVGRMIPTEAEGLNLNVNNNKTIIRKIIDNQIKTSVKNRNNDSSSEGLNYLQLFNLYYKDGADMLTVGGIIYDTNQESSIINMNFENLEFISKDEKVFDITVPNLSVREMHALNMLLPSEREQAYKLPLNKDDVDHYANIYRYFPTFVEAQL